MSFIWLVSWWSVTNARRHTVTHRTSVTRRSLGLKDWTVGGLWYLIGLLQQIWRQRKFTYRRPTPLVAVSYREEFRVLTEQPRFTHEILLYSSPQLKELAFFKWIFFVHSNNEDIVLWYMRTIVKPIYKTYKFTMLKVKWILFWQS